MVHHWFLTNITTLMHGADPNFKDFDGGYVTFGGGAYGGRITGKGTIKTDNLDFDDVYFVKELKFNLFSVSQMCDKKNYVLFTDSECLVLSPNFKLPDENQILLKIPRQDNMYSFDMKNIVPKDSLTCLVAKATSEESMLWHRRLGHINFKNINKLVKENLVRDLPLKRFENDQTCVACLKGKQHRASSRTPQQNGVAERKNRTLIEAVRTIKAFRVYNTRTRKVQENLHIGFLENKPMIEGNGPKWLFDLDSLTQSMNYVPVVAGTFSNDFAGSEGFHQVIDFLNRSHICYALTKKPDVYISFIKQFWRSAEATTDDNGEVQITATIDGHNQCLSPKHL
ncbi:ribonuclease H-like domain-containing protein [Tanacetum coccineum]